MSDHKHIYFNDFTLDVEKRTLRRGGVVVKLSPRPFDLLVFLASRPGQLVSRQQIRAAVWADRFLAFDPALNFSVRQLRRALGDNALNPTLIETVPRLGYRFIARIHPVPHPIQTRPIPNWTAFGTLAAGLFLLVVTLGWLAHRRPTLDLAVSMSEGRGIPAGSLLPVALIQGIQARLADVGRIRVVESLDPAFHLATRIEPAGGDLRVTASLTGRGQAVPQWRGSFVLSPSEVEGLGVDLADEVITVTTRLGRGGVGGGEVVQVERIRSDADSNRLAERP